MKQSILKKAAYVTLVSMIAGAFIVNSILAMKDTACEGVLQTTNEFEVISGPCASDGIGFLPMTLAVFFLSVGFFTVNLWVVKRLNL